MKWAFVTLVSNEYIDAAMTLMYSIRKNSGLKGFRFIVMHSPNWCNLNSVGIKRISKSFPDTKFVECNEEYYQNINIESASKAFSNQSHTRTNPEYGARTWLLKFEALRLLPNYDKVIWLDSDTLCVGDIRYLVKLKERFAVVVRNRLGGRSIKYRGSKINAGVMVLGKKMLNKEMWGKVVDLRLKMGDQFPNGDQMAWQHFFTDKTIFVLNGKYNDFPANHKKARIIHYFAKKPWEKIQNKEELSEPDKAWQKTFEEMLRYEKNAK